MIYSAVTTSINCASILDDDNIVVKSISIDIKMHCLLDNYRRS